VNQDGGWKNVLSVEFLIGFYFEASCIATIDLVLRRTPVVL
jgi:hypothetical protein